MPEPPQLGGLLGLDDVADGFERSVGAHVEQDRILGRGADPVEFPQIELCFLSADELLDVDAIVRQHDDEPVRLRHAVDVIDCRHGSGAGHVLHHDFRISRNVFPPVPRDQSPPGVVEVAGGRSDDQPHGFAFIKVRLRMSVRQRDHAHSETEA